MIPDSKTLRANHHTEAIQTLIAQSFYASQKDWPQGVIITVSRGTIPRGGFDCLDGVVYLEWHDHSWDVCVPFYTPNGYVIEHGYPTIAACERAVKYLQSPDHVLHVFHEAAKLHKASALEYSYPDGLPIDEQP